MLQLNRLAPIAAASLVLVGLAQPAAAVPIEGGATVVTLDLASDPNFVAVATSNGIAPAAIAPGSLGGDPLAFAFPITSVAGDHVLHEGGILMTQGNVVLALTGFDIDLVTLTLSGLAVLGDVTVGVLPLFEIDGTTLGLSLTTTAADALNSVFMTGLEGAPQFGAGLSVGSARFESVPEPGSLAMLAVGLVGLVVTRRRSMS